MAVLVATTEGLIMAITVVDGEEDTEATEVTEDTGVGEVEDSDTEDGD